VCIAAGASTSQETSAQPVARNVKKAGSRTILPGSADQSQAGRMGAVAATSKSDPEAVRKVTFSDDAETRSSTRSTAHDRSKRGVHDANL
jgi:hypothetical protein